MLKDTDEKVTTIGVTNAELDEVKAGLKNLKGMSLVKFYEVKGSKYIFCNGFTTVMQTLTISCKYQQ